MSKQRLRAAIRELSDRVVAAQRPIRILDAVAWGPEVREAFFAAGCREQPPVDREGYARRPLGFDPAAAGAEFRAIEGQVRERLGRSQAAGRILLRTCREYETVLALLASRGTPDFPRLSAELYGRSGDPLHPGQPSLAELSHLLEEVLRGIDASAFLESSPKDLPTGRAVELLQERLDRAFASLGERVQVLADDGIVADAAAGSDYIKLRRDAWFSQRDLRVLEVHEGWVHVGTTLNGRAQPVSRFLEKGTPSTTITQEGLALLMEIVSFSSHPARLRRVTDRVRAIHMAEGGASFLDVFRTLREEGRSDEEAYRIGVRVFRGSTPRGGPFTKDLAYGRGFLAIYNFLRLAVRRGRLARIPLLFAGKIRLEEIADLDELREEGLLEAPRFLPPPFDDLNALTAWMAWSNFLNRLDLARIEAEFAPLLA